MKKEEVLRLVESIHKDKMIPKSVLFTGLQYSITQASCKVFDVDEEEVDVTINQTSGSIDVQVNGKTVDMDSDNLGRIAAQTTKQFFKSKILEAEKDMIAEEFSNKMYTLLSAEVLRRERGNVFVNVIGYNFEAVIPREEQVSIERYRTGDRLRCLVVSMNSKSNKVNLVLSRTRPELVHELFITDVPEIADEVIVVQELAREPGFRTKIAVQCDNPKIDCVGACVGPRGTRIRNIINELGGEKIDIIPWSPIPETFISNALAPARISRVYLDRDSREAIVVVPDDQLSLAIGKKGQNVRLTCRLTRWNVDVKSEAEFDQESKGEENPTKGLDAMKDTTVNSELSSTDGVANETGSTEPAGSAPENTKESEN
jgi:N utilization substance protein A